MIRRVSKSGIRSNDSTKKRQGPPAGRGTVTDHAPENGKHARKHGAAILPAVPQGAGRE